MVAELWNIFFVRWKDVDAGGYHNSGGHESISYAWNTDLAPESSLESVSRGVQARKIKEKVTWHAQELALYCSGNCELA